MGSHPDVLIIGGGVIGLSTAYFLAREGAAVQVLDRSAPGTEASWAGAGIIPPGNPERGATAYDRLRGESSRAFPDLSAELRERTGIDNGYRVCGGVEVFEHPAPNILAIWQTEGIAHIPLLPADARRLEPGVHLPAAECYHLPDMAQVRNPRHLRALVNGCERLGVRIEPDTPVVRFETTGGRLMAAVAESGVRFPADRYLIASGAWSDRLLRQLGLQTGVHPVRGQMVLFNPGRALLSRVVCVEKRYLVPRDDGRILVGSTEEPEAGFEKRTTEAGVAVLADFAVRLLPEVAGLSPEKSWAGLRPGSPDGMPYLGRIPGTDNAFLAAGHYRAGIQLSPTTARIMADLLAGRPPTVPIDAFRPDRPPGAPVRTAFRS
jgi:glycine oxidase